MELVRALNRDFREKLQYKLPKMRVGSKAVWNFSENPSVLVLSYHKLVTVYSTALTPSLMVFFLPNVGVTKN